MYMKLCIIPYQETSTVLCSLREHVSLTRLFHVHSEISHDGCQGLAAFHCYWPVSTLQEFVGFPVSQSGRRPRLQNLPDRSVQKLSISLDGTHFFRQDLFRFLWYWLQVCWGLLQPHYKSDSPGRHMVGLLVIFKLLPKESRNETGRFVLLYH